MGAEIFVFLAAVYFMARNSVKDAVGRVKDTYRRERDRHEQYDPNYPGDDPVRVAVDNGAAPKARKAGRWLGGVTRTVRGMLTNSPGVPHGEARSAAFWAGFFEALNATEWQRQKETAWDTWAKYHNVPLERNPYRGPSCPHQVPPGHHGPPAPPLIREPVNDFPVTTVNDYPLIDPLIDPNLRREPVVCPPPDDNADDSTETPGRVLTLAPPYTENKEQDMQGLTVEINNAADLAKAMEGVIEDARTELEDAQATLERAGEFAAQIESITAQLTELSIDPAIRDAVGGLGDTTSTKAAAEQSVADCEKRIADAEAVLDALKKSAQGSFYVG